MNWKAFIARLLMDFRMSSYKLHKEYGINSAIISNIKRGATEAPSQETVHQLEKAFGIIINDSDPNNITYTPAPTLASELARLSTKNNDPIQPITTEELANAIARRAAGNKNPYSAHFSVPLRFEYKVVGKIKSGGAMAYVNADIIGTVTIEEDLGKNIFCIEIEDNDMLPEVKKGDFAIINPDIEVKRGHLVAFVMNGRQMVRELNYDKDGTMMLISHNANSYPLFPKDGEIEVMYKIIATHTKPKLRLW